MASKATSSCKSKQSKKSRVPSVTCPVCEEPIVDGTAKSPGHDSIECEGACKAWLHRGCAGLSKAAFEAATVSPDPFLCPHCRLVAQSSELSALKSSVDTLSRELSSLKAVVDDLKANVSLSSPPVWVNVPNPTESHSPAQLPTVLFSSLGNHEPVKPVNQHASKSPVHPISSDKKYNIVLFVYWARLLQGVEISWRSRTRGRSQCMPHQVGIRIPRLPCARYQVMAS